MYDTETAVDVSTGMREDAITSTWRLVLEWERILSHQPGGLHLKVNFGIEKSFDVGKNLTKMPHHKALICDLEALEQHKFSDFVT